MQTLLAEMDLTTQYWPERSGRHDARPMTALGKIQKFARRKLLREEAELE